MGNNQSAEAPRRLTKPRTNTSTTNLLAGASMSRRNSTLEPPIATKKRASLILRGDVTDAAAAVPDSSENCIVVDRQQRWSLFRSNSSAQELTGQKFDPSEEAPSTETSHPLQRYSGVSSLQVDRWEDFQRGPGSINRPPIRNTRGVMTQNPHSQQMTRLSLVAEVQTPEPMVEDESRQVGFKVAPSEEFQPEDSTLTPIERSSSNHSLSKMGIPIRWRSILTSGAAARNRLSDSMYKSSQNLQPSSTITPSEPSGWASTSPDHQSLPLRNAFSFDYMTRRYDDEAHYRSVPLEGTAALRPPPEVDSQTRVSTPSDLEYRHTGAFKLGSLRITNGSASPAPSVHERIFWDSSPQKTDGEGRRHQQYGSPSRRMDNPYERAEDVLQSVPLSRIDDLNAQPVANEPPRILHTTVEIPDSILAFDFASEFSHTRQIETETPRSAHELAMTYMQDIASSPFSFDETPPSSPQLEATSKHTAMEDHLFDDESDFPFSRSISPPGDISRQSSRSTADQPLTEHLSLPNRTVSIFDANHVGTRQTSREPIVKPLQKADSGYSSKTSLRSFGSRISNLEKEPPREERGSLAIPNRDTPPPPVPGKSPPPPPTTIDPIHSPRATTAPNALQGVQQLHAEYYSEDPLNARIIPMVPDYASECPGLIPASNTNSFQPRQARMPSLDGLRLNPYRGSSVIAERPSHRTRHSQPPPLPIKSIQENQAAARIGLNDSELLGKPKPNRRQSAPNLVPTHANGLRSKPSDSDINTPTKRRLQKPRYSLAPEVVVQGFTEIDAGSIPPVSQDASDHLEERLRNFPTLSHTYKSVHKTNSKETLVTILSAGSLEAHADDRMASSRLEGRLSMLSTASSNEAIEQFVSTASFGQTLAPARAAPAAPKLTISQRQSRGSLIQSRDFASSPSTADVSTDLNTSSESMGSGSSGYPAMNPIDQGSHRSHDTLAMRNKRSSEGGFGRTIGMDSRSAAQLARDRSRVLRHHSSEEWATSMQQNLGSSTAQSQNNMVENRPLPDLPSRGGGENLRPPVSMKTQLALTITRPSASARSPPSPSDMARHSSSRTEWRETPIPSGSQWQDQRSHWHERRRGSESMRPPVEGWYSEPLISRSAGPRTSSEQPGQRSQVIYKTPSFEGQGQPTSQAPLPRPVRKMPPSAHQNRSFQNQRNAIARHVYDPLPPRRDQEATCQPAAVDSGAGSRWKSMSNDAPPVPITVDRYNGGYGYGFERGLGVGGSAGLRNEGTTASRKGVEGSVLWGLDFSDVPIMVQQRPRGLEV